SLCMPEDELRTLVVRLIVEGRIEGGRITVVDDESVLEVPSKFERAASCASSAHYDAIRNWLNAANKLSEMCSAMVSSLPASEKDVEEDGRARQQYSRRAGPASHFQRHYEGAPRRYQGGRARQQPAESSATNVVPSPSSATSVDDDGDIVMDAGVENASLSAPRRRLVEDAAQT
ncbi:COP9 signalosome complex subunit 2, partial [Perkinsus olseni]